MKVRRLEIDGYVNGAAVVAHCNACGNVFTVPCQLCSDPSGAREALVQSFDNHICTVEY